MPIAPATMVTGPPRAGPEPLETVAVPFCERSDPPVEAAEDKLVTDGVRLYEYP